MDMKKTLKVGLYVAVVVLTLTGGWTGISVVRAISQHLAQDHLNAHIVNAVINHNIQTGKLELPPEFKQAPAK